MTNKEKKKFFRRRAGWLAIKTFTTLSGILSLEWNYFIGKVLGSIAYLVVVRHRKFAFNNLSAAFPRKSSRQIRRITRDFFIFMAQGSFELLHFLKNPRQLSGIRIEGRGNLDAALSQGRGVIILTAHLGNFPLMSLKLAKLGYPTNIVARPMRDRQAGSYIHDLRTASGVKTIFSYPRRECVNTIIKALRNNEVVIIQMDQNFGTGGVWVRFFGRLAATPVGPITLSLRTKAAIVPGYIVREDQGRHCIRIFPQEDLAAGAGKDETVLLNAVKFTRMIESWIREAESQWVWIHRRWKSRPSDKVKKMGFRIEEG